MLRCGQVVNELYQVALTLGLRDIRRVLAVDDNQRHALDVITLCQLLGALQVGIDAEGVVRLRIVFGRDTI